MAHRSDGGVVRFDVTAHRGTAADWAVTWNPASPPTAQSGSPVDGATVLSSPSRQSNPFRCSSRRSFIIHLRGAHGEHLRSAHVFIGHRRVRVLTRMRALIDLRGRPKERVTVRILGVTRTGRRTTAKRLYHLCVRRRPPTRGGPR